MSQQKATSLLARRDPPCGDVGHRLEPGAAYSQQSTQRVGERVPRQVIDENGRPRGQQTRDG
jgi:hypothetical protein